VFCCTPIRLVGGPTSECWLRLRSSTNTLEWSSTAFSAAKYPAETLRSRYDALYRRVYRRLYDRLRPLYEDIRDITGYPGEAAD
jgi:hypothetical protein